METCDDNSAFGRRMFRWKWQWVQKLALIKFFSNFLFRYLSLSGYPVAVLIAVLYSLCCFLIFFDGARNTGECSEIELSSKKIIPIQLTRQRRFAPGHRARRTITRKVYCALENRFKCSHFNFRASAANERANGVSAQEHFDHSSLHVEWEARPVPALPIPGWFQAEGSRPELWTKRTVRTPCKRCIGKGVSTSSDFTS